MTTPRHARLFAFALFGLVLAPPAAAETTLCTAITSLPYTISVPGTYCLLGNLTTSMSEGVAISIEANAVTLDLNGHKLAGNAGSATTARGIVAFGRFVVVKNGTVRGFLIGVVIGGVAGVIEDIVSERTWHMGLWVGGQGMVVRRNLVVNTGGSVCCAFNPGPIGIHVDGTSGASIVDNDVRGVGFGPAGIGIRVLRANDTFVERNRVSNANDQGVWVDASSAVLLSDNRFTSMPLAIHFTGSSGKYRNNQTVGVTTLATGGTDAGGND
jgi:parallel beta-helix repeat protein